MAGGPPHRQATNLRAGKSAEGSWGRAGEGTAPGLFFQEGKRQAEAEKVWG